jgi:hypothetical protein
METKKNYKGYIASTKESKAFDSVLRRTKESAITAIKRCNSSRWKDCCVWCVYVHADGQEEKV